MKLVYIISVLTWIILLVFDGALSSNSYTFQSRNEDNNIYVVHDNNWFKSSKFSNERNSFSTRRKRKVEVRMGGIQHVFESPQRSYDNQNLGNSQGQMEFGGSTPSEFSGNVAPSDSMTTVPILSQSPEVSVEQAASKSFSSNMVDKLSQAQRSDSAMPNSLNKYGSMPSSSQMEEINSQTAAQYNLRSDSLLGSLYNKDEMLNSPSQTEGANGQGYSPNLPDNFHSDPMIANLPNKDGSSISPFQTEEANIQNIPQEHFSSDSSLSNPSRDDLLMSSSQAQKTYIENTPHEHFHTDPTLPNLATSSSHIVEPHTILPLGDLNHFHTANLHIDDITAHPFTSHVGDPTLEPSNPHIEPVIHPDSGPQVINPLGPDNLHIIKKFYPLPVVQKVPKPIPVFVTKPVPYPVHQTRFQHVPQPYPQPFSKPDVHLSYIHLENRANPCKHGGIIVQSPGGYTCLCRKAYKGKHCQERDKCYPYPCENNGDCIDHGTHYECRCPRGFKGINCEVADKCHNHPCKNDAKCIQLLSDIKCICSPGYKGKYCEDIDHCHPNPCRHGGKCEELNQAASCSCTAEFKGSRCQVPKTCSLNLCRNGATCLEDKPSSPCLCAPGFSGRYCTEDVCLPNPCQHNGKCYPIRSDVNTTWYPGCKCSATYKGNLCQVPNLCASNPSPCVHGICYDAYTNVDQVEIPPEGYTCHCYEGYFGINCQYRKCDHCDVNARCLDGFKCTCNEGYQGDGQDCQKIPDPCVPNPCRNEGLCKAELNTFECKCVPGFKGKTCQEKTPCSSVVSPCRNGGTCIEVKNDFRCICAREWKGKDCSENATSLCIGNRCLNGGTCRVSEDGKSWYCVCRGPRFKPPDCACNCPANAHIPTERNLTCNNPQGLCECPQGYKHHKGREVCIDESTKVITGKGERGCDPNPCKNGGKCVSLTSSKWMCQCTQGWSGKICDVKVPIEKNSSCVPNPCENGGICSIVNDAAVCACPEGYLPPLCELKGRTACFPNPCLNAGRCVKAGEGYDCICDQRFTGPNCEVDRCKKCDPVNAVCNLGQCSCKTGFVGNGYQCLPEKKVNVCIMCHPVKAACVDNSCQCKSGYVGNGYQCTESHPGTVQYQSSSNSQQIPWFKRNGIL